MWGWHVKSGCEASVNAHESRYFGWWVGSGSGGSDIYFWKTVFVSDAGGVFRGKFWAGGRWYPENVSVLLTIFKKIASAKSWRVRGAFTQLDFMVAAWLLVFALSTWRTSKSVCSWWYWKEWGRCVVVDLFHFNWDNWWVEVEIGSANFVGWEGEEWNKH